MSYLCVWHISALSRVRRISGRSSLRQVIRRQANQPLRQLRAQRSDVRLATTESCLSSSSYSLPAHATLRRRLPFIYMCRQRRRRWNTSIESVYSATAGCLLWSTIVPGLLARGAYLHMPGCLPIHSKTLALTFMQLQRRPHRLKNHYFLTFWRCSCSSTAIIHSFLDRLLKSECH